MTTMDDPVNVELLERIVGEYREMPGLALTVAQAGRLWGCDRDGCQRVVGLLVERGILRWSRDGLLIRAW